MLEKWGSITGTKQYNVFFSAGSLVRVAMHFLSPQRIWRSEYVVSCFVHVFFALLPFNVTQREFNLTWEFSGRGLQKPRTRFMVTPSPANTKKQLFSDRSNTSNRISFQDYQVIASLFSMAGQFAPDQRGLAAAALALCLYHLICHVPWRFLRARRQSV